MNNRVSKTDPLRVFFAIITLAFVFTLATPLHALTFQTIPALSFTMPYAGANPLPQIVTVASTSGALRFTPVASTSSGGNWLSVSPASGGCCNAPYPVTVSVSAAGLAAGTYQGQVVFTDYTNPNNKLTVPVTLTVAQSNVAFFDDLPGKLSFSFKTGGSATSQPIQIRNGGTGTLNWTLTASTGIGGNWLSASASSGTAPSTISVSITKANLPGGGSTAGTFVGQLLLQASGDSVTIPVAVTVGSAVFEQVNPISFTMPFGGTNPLPQILTIGSSDNSALRFTPVAATAKGGNWLSVSPASGGCCNTPYPVTVSVSAGTLPAGTYTGEITIYQYGANPAMSMTVPVTLTIEASGAFFDNLPGGLSFSFKTNGTATSQVIQIGNGGSGTLNWTVAPTTSDTSNWLTVSSSSGTAPSVLTVGVNASLLPGGGAISGTFVGQLLFQTPGDTTTIPVAVTVGSAVFDQVNPISLTMPFGGANPLPQILTIGSTDNSALRFTPVAATAKGGNWLSVSPASGGCCNTPYPVTVSVSAGTLPAGTYTGEITIYQFGANPAMSMTVPVSLTIEALGPFFDNLPGQLSFSLTKGGVATSQKIPIGNGGAGTLNWTLAATTADGGNWLTTSASSGTAPSAVTVGVNPVLLPGNGLIAGTFVGQLLLQTAGDMTSIPVSVTVGDAVFEQVNPISFTMPFGGANPLPQILTIGSTDNSALRFTPVAATAKGGNWLSVSPASGGCCNTPYPVTVSVSAGTLPAGTYTGEITIYQYGANPAMSMTVPVTLTIEASGAFLDNLPGQMSFSMKKGGKVTPQTLQIGNGGTGKLKFTITPSTADGGAWLKPSILAGTAPKTITVSIVPTALPGAGQLAGTFVGQLLLEAAGDTTTIPVTVTVGDAVFTQLNPINFVMPFGGANPLPQILTVASTDAATTLRFTPVASTATGGNWLSVSPSSGGCCNTPFPVTVSINAPSLKAGTYTGEITIYQFGANPGMSGTVPVTLTVVATSKAFFDNVPGQTSFSFKPSSANPPSQTIQVGNGGAGTLNWSVSASTADTSKWLKVLPTKGVGAGSYTVSVTAKSLPGKGLLAGTFLGQQLLKATTGNVTIPVVVTVGDPVFVQLPTVTFNTARGVNPAPQVISVASTGTVIRFTPIAVSGKGGNWLSVSPSSGGCCNTPTNVTVSANASALAAGTYVGQINVMQFGANPAQSMAIPVVLNVSSAADETSTTTTANGEAP